jgi:hypothetical protein
LRQGARRPAGLCAVIRGAIECTNCDALEPAIRCLEATARENPEELFRAWEVRVLNRRP